MGTMQDYDPGETQEWVDSLNAVIAHVGPERARHLLGKLRDEALRTGTMPPFLATTPYRNTIPLPTQAAVSATKPKRATVFFMPRPKEQLRFQLTCRAADFKDLHKVFLRSLFSIQGL